MLSTLFERSTSYLFGARSPANLDYENLSQKTLISYHKWVFVLEWLSLAVCWSNSCLIYLTNSWPAWLMLGMESHSCDLGMNSHPFLFTFLTFWQKILIRNAYFTPKIKEKRNNDYFLKFPKIIKIRHFFVMSFLIVDT